MGSPAWGMPGVSQHLYSGWNRHPKIDVQASAPISLQSLEQREVGVEEVMVSHIFLASLV